MSPVYGLGAPQGAAPARPTRPPGRAGAFQLATPPAVAEATASIETVALGGLLALQEAMPDSVRDRAARRHAQQMLDLLREMQRAMLAGGSTQGGEITGGLTRLAELGARAVPADDPRLAGVLHAIAVRAAVELARHERVAAMPTGNTKMSVR